MKPWLRVKITIIFSSIQLPLSVHCDFFGNPASTYTYYKPINGHHTISSIQILLEKKLF